MKKIVVYKTLFCFCATPLENFNKRIQNERLIHKFFPRDGFKSAQEIIDHLVKFYEYSPDDFIIDKSCG